MMAYPPANTTSVGQTVDRTATALDDVCIRLDCLYNQFMDTTSRMHQLNIRFSGPVPEKGPDAKPSPQSDTLHSLIITKLDLLSAVAEAQNAQIVRLERIL